VLDWMRIPEGQFVILSSFVYEICEGDICIPRALF
jgi:hypothetical protein